ncbi:hypothetical protein D3C75_775240 [compost metagenome]
MQAEYQDLANTSTTSIMTALRILRLRSGLNAAAAVVRATRGLAVRYERYHLATNHWTIMAAPATKVK